MINSRQSLYDTALNMYKNLMTRTAERYFSGETYVVSDYIGFSCTQVEEIFRPLWGIAPFLKNGDIEITVKGEKTTVSNFITLVMREGTDKNGSKRFDKDVTEFNKIVFANQSITEIAAYLVAVYFAPECLWKPLGKDLRDQIACWIRDWAICALKNSWANNHYWYPIFCIEILKKLGYDLSEVDEDMQKGYDFLETFYVGNGWYCDGAFGRFDYYEAWAHHTYPLLWILLTDLSDEKNKKRAEEYKKRSGEFLNFFAHYFDSDGGMAAYGRSIGYRFGAVAPFGLAALTGCNIDLGLCKNVILKNINYFFEKSIPTKDGIFPCGYLYETTGFAENYASDGAISCYTEGLICLLADENHPLWKSEITPLPIEKGDYTVATTLKGLELTLCGENKVSGVTLYNNSVHYYQSNFFGHRFNDMAGYYGKFAYNSRSGFGISTVDNPSVDNMISLYTPDGRMTSYRKKIEDYYTLDGVMVSTHTPFSNDAATKIKTYLLPLREGWHLRVHKVTLSQEYLVYEGGYSVGIRDDGFVAKENTVSYRKIKSEIKVFTDQKTVYDIHRTHPGMHLLQPQALYPVYKTDALAKGEYLFATLVGFSTDGEEHISPKVTLNANRVKVVQGDFEKEIEVD